MPIKRLPPPPWPPVWPPLVSLHFCDPDCPRDCAFPPRCLLQNLYSGCLCISAARWAFWSISPRISHHVCRSLLPHPSPLMEPHSVGLRVRTPRQDGGQLLPALQFSDLPGHTALLVCMWCASRWCRNGNGGSTPLSRVLLGYIIQDRAVYASSRLDIQPSGSEVAFVTPLQVGGHLNRWPSSRPVRSPDWTGSKGLVGEVFISEVITHSLKKTQSLKITSPCSFACRSWTSRFKLINFSDLTSYHLSFWGLSTQMENLPFFNPPRTERLLSIRHTAARPGGKHCSSQCSCGWCWWAWEPTWTGRVSYAGACGPGRWWRRYSGGPFIKRK